MAALTRLTKVTFDKEASKPTLLQLKFSESDVMKPMIAEFGNVVNDIVIDNVPTHA